MWHDILVWLPTITDIAQAFTAVINLTIAVGRLRRWWLTER